MAGFLGHVVRYITDMGGGKIVDRTVVDSDIEFRGLVDFEKIDLTSDTITYSNTSTNSFDGVTYSGGTFSFTDRDGAIADILNVGVQSTVGVTVAASRLSFSADQVSIAFGGALGPLRFAPGSSFTVDVDFADASLTAVDDVASTSEDQAIPAGSSVLGNDSHSEGDGLVVGQVGGQATGVGTPVGGSGGGLFTIGANGSWSFDPNGAFEALGGGEQATTSITYSARDNNFTAGPSDTGTLTVTITGVNDAPVAVDDTLSAVKEDSGQRTIVPSALTANDTDADGDARTITAVDAAVGGTASLADDGNVLFTPTANFAGTASFAYTVSDGNGGSDTATASFAVQNVLEPQVHAGNGDNTVTGTSLDDQLFGDNGNDLLLGLGDNDVLDGGRGNDTLDGGIGSDWMTGGAGLDRFAFGLGAGQYPDGSSITAPNVVTDYQDGTDRFLIDTSETGANDFAGDIVVAQVGAHVRLTIQNDADQTQAVALLSTEQAANINVSDFLFIA